jgi:EF-hand domain-containing protein 1
MIKRAQSEQTLQGRRKSASDDKLRRFLEYSGMVLKFDCVLDDTNCVGGDLISFKLFYYLEDDTVCIKELPENQQGRDHFPKLLKRTKLPKNPLKKPSNFPTVALETTEMEIEEFYHPKDFIIGNKIIVFGRSFLLLDCDKFTRTYFEQVLRSPQPSNGIQIKKPEVSEIKIVSILLCFLTIQ